MQIDRDNKIFIFYQNGCHNCETMSEVEYINLFDKHCSKENTFMLSTDTFTF